MKKYLELIRIRHWVKNLLVFLPLFFSGNILDFDKLLLGTMGCLVFCFLSSSIYIINDIVDLESDKIHPIKKNRPLASERVSKRKAYIVFAITSMLFILLGLYFYLKVKNILIIIIPIVYLAVNILYSYILKKIPILDVMIIVFGFVLRVIYGGISTDIFVSKYLYLLIIFGSFFLAFGKRRGEYIKTDLKSRDVLNKYDRQFLDKNMYVSYTISLVCYILWCVDADVVNTVGHDYLFWTIPLVMVIFQIYSLDIEKGSYADPVDVIFSNKILLITVFIYILVVTTLIYVI